MAGSLLGGGRRALIYNQLLQYNNPFISFYPHTTMQKLQRQVWKCDDENLNGAIDYLRKSLVEYLNIEEVADHTFVPSIKWTRGLGFGRKFRGTIPSIGGELAINATYVVEQSERDILGLRAHLDNHEIWFSYLEGTSQEDIALVTGRMKEARLKRI